MTAILPFSPFLVSWLSLGKTFFMVLSISLEIMLKYVISILFYFNFLIINDVILDYLVIVINF